MPSTQSRPASFSEALAAYRALDTSDTSNLLRFDPKQYENVHQAADVARVSRPHCEGCGYPKGEAGWVRFSFPVNHPFFGQAFKCPRCNDRAPF